MTKSGSSSASTRDVQMCSTIAAEICEVNEARRVVADDVGNFWRAAAGRRDRHAVTQSGMPLGICFSKKRPPSMPLG